MRTMAVVGCLLASSGLTAHAADCGWVLWQRIRATVLETERQLTPSWEIVDGVDGFAECRAKAEHEGNALWKTISRPNLPSVGSGAMVVWVEKGTRYVAEFLCLPGTLDPRESVTK